MSSAHWALRISHQWAVGCAEQGSGQWSQPGEAVAGVTVLFPGGRVGLHHMLPIHAKVGYWHKLLVKCLPPARVT